MRSNGDWRPWYPPGGDIRSDDPGTIVSVVDPWGEIAVRLRLGIGALATSSTTRRRWKAGDREVCHLIDPRTMAPIETPILSASVLVRSALEAEAAAKTVLLRGEDGLAWAAETAWVDAAVVVWHDGSVYATPGIEVAGMSVEWLIIRGSGVVAFALLSVATIWGLLVSTKLLGRLVRAKPLTWFHESLGIGALLATLIHVGVLSVHDFLDFSWAEILVPGLSDWRPPAVTAGIGAFYGLVLVSTSFYFKRWIGQKAWRVIHFASFGVFVTSLAARGLGWDRHRHPLMIGLYLGSAIVVFSLVALRIVGETPARGAPAKEPMARDDGGPLDSPVI